MRPQRVKSTKTNTSVLHVKWRCVLGKHSDIRMWPASITQVLIDHYIRSLSYGHDRLVVDKAISVADIWHCVGTTIIFTE